MRKSPLFLAFLTLMAGLLLAYFGLMATRPLGPTSDDNGNDDRDSVNLAAPLAMPIVAFGNPVKGPSDAIVTIVEFGDYECSACTLIQEPLHNAIAKFPTEVRLIWKDAPNTMLHPEAVKAAIAARCAGEQGMFWEYHSALFGSEYEIEDTLLTLIAEDIGLDASEFQTCVLGRETLPSVEKDIEEAIRLQIDATPYLFIGETRVSGLVTGSQLETFIRLEVAKARAEKAAAEKESREETQSE